MSLTLLYPVRLPPLYFPSVSDRWFGEGRGGTFRTSWTTSHRRFLIGQLVGRILFISNERMGRLVHHTLSQYVQTRL